MTTLDLFLPDGRSAEVDTQPMTFQVRGAPRREALVAEHLDIAGSVTLSNV